MAEFVEQSLEQLVPCLEQLQATQLLKNKEVAQLVKRCRRYEYRLQKLSKRADDFLNYASYLEDLLQLIRERRHAMGYEFKKGDIDSRIKLKINSIYGRLCQRFQGNVDYWKSYINFAKKHRLKGQASRAYVSAIQMHPHCLELRVECALWEFKQNGSVENGRRVIQMALRSHPDAISLWETLLQLEISFVKRLEMRKRVLLGKKVKTKGGEAVPVEDEEEDDEEGGGVGATPLEEVTDAVLQLRLADVIIEQAIAHFTQNEPDRLTDLLFALWKCSRSYGEMSERLTVDLEERLESRGEEAKWRVQVIKRKDDGEVEIMDEALSRPSVSPQLRRFFIGLCSEMENDALAKLRIREQLAVLCNAGEATEEELNQLLLSPDSLEKDTIEAALKRFPRKGALWYALLEKEEEELGEEPTVKAVTAFAKRINSVISKVVENESLELYKMAIDFAIAHQPETVEKVFKKAIDHAVGEVRGELKAFRVDYLLSLYEENEMETTALEKEVKGLVDSLPNTEHFYLHASSRLSEMEPPLPALVDYVLLSGVNELSSSSARLWLERAEFLLLERPLEMADLYKRAMLSLQPALADSFIEEYTSLQQRSVLSDPR